jgi:hypothetical protein
LKADLLGFLVSKIHTYDQSKGFKSFSYFSVVAKNYLIAMNNSHYKNNLRHISLHKDHKPEDDLVQLEIDQALKYEPETPTPFVDEDFLSILKDYWFQQQINTDTPAFFDKKYNCILAEVLRVIENPSDYTIEAGRKDFNNLIRESAEVQKLDAKYPTRISKTARSTQTLKKIRKVNGLAYKHYLKHGDLKELRLTKNEAFNLYYISKKKSEWKKKKLQSGSLT